MVVHGEYITLDDGLEFFQALTALLEQLGVARSHCGKFRRTEVLIREHLLIRGDVNLRDVAHHKDALFDLIGIANKVIHLLQGIVILFGVVVEFLHLLESVKGILYCLRGGGNLLDRIGNVAGKITGIIDRPLCVSFGN